MYIIIVAVRETSVDQRFVTYVHKSSRLCKSPCKPHSSSTRQHSTRQKEKKREGERARYMHNPPDPVDTYIFIRITHYGNQEFARAKRRIPKHIGPKRISNHDKYTTHIFPGCYMNYSAHCYRVVSVDQSTWCVSGEISMRRPAIATAPISSGDHRLFSTNRALSTSFW